LIEESSCISIEAEVGVDEDLARLGVCSIFELSQEIGERFDLLRRLASSLINSFGDEAADEVLLNVLGRTVEFVCIIITHDSEEVVAGGAHPQLGHLLLHEVTRISIVPETANNKLEQKSRELRDRF